MRATCFSQSQTELSFTSRLPVRLPAGDTDVLALLHKPVYFHSSWLGTACPVPVPVPQHSCSPTAIRDRANKVVRGKPGLVWRVPEGHGSLSSCVEVL